MSEAPFIEITRAGQRFKVVNTPGAASWDFWGFYSGSQWEPTTIGEADRILKPGDLLIDIGAWIGPLTLWEASRGVRVLALEPDPIAAADLRFNILANNLHGLVSVEEVAVTDKVGTAKLQMNLGGADSQSSIMRTDMVDSVEVATTTLTELLGIYAPDLVKMDIEGGESIVLPRDGHLLRETGIPLLLALHPQWYAEGSSEAMEEELSHWNMKDLYNNMWLCQAKA